MTLAVVGRNGVTMFLAKNVFCCHCAASDCYMGVENAVTRRIHYYGQESEDVVLWRNNNAIF